MMEKRCKNIIVGTTQPLHEKDAMNFVKESTKASNVEKMGTVPHTENYGNTLPNFGCISNAEKKETTGPIKNSSSSSPIFSEKQDTVHMPKTDSNIRHFTLGVWGEDRVYIAEKNPSNPKEI